MNAVSTVVDAGSMAKGARRLAMSQPSVSEAIANLEHILRVRLLDRGPKGIAPTMYADVLLRRSATVFDELKQSVRDIEFMCDPTVGEMTIGAPEIAIGTLLPPIIERYAAKYPGVTVRVDSVASYRAALPPLRSRQFDLIMNWFQPSQIDSDDDLKIELLFEDPLVVACGSHNPWARRRKINLAELVHEPWIMQAPNTWNYTQLSDAFKARGLAMPRASLVTHSLLLIVHFLTSGPYVTSYPRFAAQRSGLKILPVDLELRLWPVIVTTLRHRTLSPVVERFIECAREVTKTIACMPKGNAGHAWKLNVS
jgi:DNA-binding transcriptional LysR family regulator